MTDQGPSRADLRNAARMAIGQLLQAAAQWEFQSRQLVGLGLPSAPKLSNSLQDVYSACGLLLNELAPWKDDDAPAIVPGPTVEIPDEEPDDGEG